MPKVTFPTKKNKTKTRQSSDSGTGPNSTKALATKKKGPGDNEEGPCRGQGTEGFAYLRNRRLPDTEWTGRTTAGQTELSDDRCC